MRGGGNGSRAGNTRDFEAAVIFLLFWVVATQVFLPLYVHGSAFVSFEFN